MKLDSAVEQIMKDRFGKDTVLALATVSEGIPYVRQVDAYYESGSFYVITYAKSHKMKHISAQPEVAVAGEWFTGHGKAINLGFFGREENHALAQQLRKVFASWIDNGHNDFADENTIILQIELVDGVLFSQGTKYTF